MLKFFKEIWSLVSWLKMNNVQKRMLFWLSSCDLFIVACVQSPLPSGNFGEGALLRFFLRAGGSVHPLSALWKRNARPVTVFFVLCSMLFTCTGTRHKTKKTTFSKWCQPFVSCLVSVRPFFPTWRFFTTWMTTIRDKSSWRPCLKRVLLSTIISFCFTP